MCKRNVFGGLLAVGILLIGAGSWALAQEPIDDAYYWPASEHKSKASTTKTSTTNSGSSAQKSATAKESAVSQPAEPEKSIEYVNVQDTTVTIRVK